MARLFISADLEGAAWITSPRQCTPAGDAVGYQHAVDQLAKELRYVTETAFAEGATEIVVNDSHMSMVNLDPSHLDSRVKLLSGKPKNCSMAAGLDKNFDAMFLIGYHAKAGSEKGILNHTFHDKLWDVSVNGVSYGEGGINALHASLTYGVPVVLASGDAVFCQEIQGHVPGVTTVQTKTSLTTTATLSLSENELAAVYQNAVQSVMQQKGKWKTLSMKGPYILKMTFVESLNADCVCIMPWVKRLDGRTVEYTAETFEELYRALQSSYALLAYTNYMAI